MTRCSSNLVTLGKARKPFTSSGRLCLHQRHFVTYNPPALTCGMRAMALRSCRRPKHFVLTWSTVMQPESISVNRNRAPIRLQKGQKSAQHSTAQHAIAWHAWHGSLSFSTQLELDV